MNLLLHMKFNASKSEEGREKCNLLLLPTVMDEVMHMCGDCRVMSSISNIHGVQCTMYNVGSVYLILKGDNVNKTIKQSMMAVSGARLTGCSPKYFSIK